MDYPGTVICVSHDRYFLNKIPTRILELKNDGLTEYLGTYDYYMEKKDSIGSGTKYLKEMAENEEKNEKTSENISLEKKTLSSAEERALKKKQEALERRTAREKERLEKLIETLEKQVSDLDAEMCKPENLQDHVVLNELNEKREKLTEELDEVYEKWMELQ